MYNKYKSFDLKTFKKEFESGDLCGLEYLEKTIITEMKKQIEENNKKGVMHFTIEEYITSLFYATMELNNCNNIYETESRVNTRFSYDIYALVRDKLFQELGFNEMRKGEI